MGDWRSVMDPTADGREARKCGLARCGECGGWVRPESILKVETGALNLAKVRQQRPVEWGPGAGWRPRGERVVWIPEVTRQCAKCRGVKEPEVTWQPGPERLTKAAGFRRFQPTQR